ncbi:MAG: ATP-binding cassette domain-containing protein [Clostridium sp.]|uniref:ATP-binding cassette domain-containing protein n=1 Tax=Clostridium sp. TaxID=1506 RepID=UPI0029159E08|nr:ATP-binding cassette domain-containing protein [Clostridium sp.]MDU5111756.1 ATP-binding cassette domain-containing protein [Clostridium sp.]
MIKYKNINISFGDRILYKDFSIDIKEKDINFIMGESGVGKTTLIKYIMDKLLMKDEDISVVFQEPRLLPWKNVYENLELVLNKKCTNKEKEIKIRYILKELNLNNCENLYPHELSGGMRQRVSIARALLYDGNIFIMDEPFKGLDKENKNKIIDFIYSYLKEKEKTTIIISHDVSEITRVKTNCIYLKGEPVASEIINLT